MHETSFPSLKSLITIFADYKKTQNSEWIFPSPVKPNSPRDPATMAIDGGMDIKTLSDMIGDTSVSTTLDVYIHSTDKMKQDAACEINGKRWQCYTKK